MPLLSGVKNIGRNIRELEHPSRHAPGGRPHRQALAIALKTAGIRRVTHHLKVRHGKPER